MFIEENEGNEESIECGLRASLAVFSFMRMGLKRFVKGAVRLR